MTALRNLERPFLKLMPINLEIKKKKSSHSDADMLWKD